jgi:hypothetical protein
MPKAPNAPKVYALDIETTKFATLSNQRADRETATASFLNEIGQNVFL